MKRRSKKIKEKTVINVTIYAAAMLYRLLATTSSSSNPSCALYSFGLASLPWQPLGCLIEFQGIAIIGIPKDPRTTQILNSFFDEDVFPKNAAQIHTCSRRHLKFQDPMPHRRSLAAIWWKRPQKVGIRILGSWGSNEYRRSNKNIIQI